MPLKVRTEHTTPTATTTTPQTTPQPASLGRQAEEISPPKSDKKASQRAQLDKINLYHRRKVTRKWNEIVADQGTFSILVNVEYGAVKSSNKRKETQHAMKRKDKKKEEILKRQAAEDLRKELKLQSDRKSKNFFEEFNEKKRKRKTRNNYMEMEDSQPVHKIKCTEDNFKLKTTDIAPPKTSLSEGQRAPTKAAIMKTNYIQEGNSTKLRKYFEFTRKDLSKADRKG